MMGSAVSFYTKGNFSNPILFLGCGTITIASGSRYKNRANWSRYGSTDLPGTGNGAICGIYVDKDDVSGGTAGVSLGGGGLLYSIANESQAETAENRVLCSDTYSDVSTTEVVNALLVGKYNTSSDPEIDNIQSIWIQFRPQAEDPEDTGNVGRIYVSVGSYNQNPVDGTRATWAYTGSYNPGGIQLDYQFRENTQFYEVRLYRGENLFGDGMDYYVWAFGVNGDALNDTPGLAPSSATYLIAMPCKIFEDVVPRDYVGPVTPDGEEGFKLPGRDMWDDSVSGRVISNYNPFGFNDPTGCLSLVRQTDAQYKILIEGIYHGVSGTVLGQLGQLVSGTGQKTRPSEEVDVMTKGILSCKLIPDFGTAVSQCTISTLCGYPLFGSLSTSGVVSIGAYVNQITPFILTLGGGIQITRTWENFLDFEPYTSMTIHLPYVTPITIDPSVLYGNTLSIWGYVDVFTGLICYNIEIIDANRTWLYATAQGNCSVDMPIIGAGSSSTSALGKIAAGLGSLGKNPIGGVFNAIEGLEAMNRQVPNTKQVGGTITPYMSPNAAYLTIDTPLPENPANYAKLYGTVARKEGIVGKFKGYSEFSAVDLSSTGATEAEKEEIIRLLKAGVFV